MSARPHNVPAAARRSLATIFDDSAVRHATTPATPLVTAAPAAWSSAAATFLSNVKSLARDHFDEKVAKLVIRKVYDEKTRRFTGAESNVNSVIAKLVLALRTAFTTEESAFGPLFDLEDATLPVRPEANRLLFSTLELIIHPTSPAADWIESSAESHPFDGKRALFEIARMLIDTGGPFQGTADLLSIKIVKDVNPLSSISAFNAALRSARRKSTLNDEEHSASGTAHGFAMIEDVSAHAYSEKYDFKQIFSGVQDMLCDMKREIKSINNRLDATKGFTPRGEKYGRGPKRFRVARSC
ncbi:hypothetical protein CYMTET_11833 [Cymbomonas tetramitiformis]|uniref:Uncharacterized protein n=1 Tax=Cymbomonas tetramitiformis TaxID=36881 RepID=A0AAE0GLT7_9CHLO|nr:hypothetical protein CYMTET_11833 [Cymbomonas tetramitiformis]